MVAPFLWAHLDLNYLVLVQHLLRVLLITATTVFCMQLDGNRLQATIAGIVLCLDLPTLEAANTILTEMLFTCIVAIAIWLLWREAGKRDRSISGSVGAGLLSGASVLVRPVAILFFLPAMVYLVLVRRQFKWRSALVFFLAMTLFPLLWSVRNYRCTGYFGVSSLAGWQMMMYRGAGVLAINDSGDFESNLGKRQKELEAVACRDLRETYQKPCAAVSIAQRTRYYSRLGRRLVAQHPIGFAKLALRGGATMMLGGDADRVAGVIGSRPEVARKLILIYTVPLAGFSVAGLCVWWKRRRSVFYLASLVVGYFVFISAGAEAYARYRVPVMPAYAILAATGSAYLFRALSRGGSGNSIDLRGEDS